MVSGFWVEIRTLDLSNVKLVTIRLFDDQNVYHVLDHPIGTSLYCEDVFATTGIIRRYKMRQKANRDCNK
jgi:hypothetical protein